MAVGNGVFVCLSVLYVYFSVPVSFGGWYLAHAVDSHVACLLSGTPFVQRLNRTMLDSFFRWKLFSLFSIYPSYPFSSSLIGVLVWSHWYDSCIDLNGFYSYPSLVDSNGSYYDLYLLVMISTLC